MKNKVFKQKQAYYNQFIDAKDVSPGHTRQKMKNFNSQAIKITPNKLPYDFFRPYTRQNQTIDVITSKPLQRQSGMKTPCFGEQRKQANSLSLIPRNKKNRSILNHIETLPLEKVQNPSLLKQQQAQKPSYRHYTQNSLRLNSKTIRNNAKNFTERNADPNQDQQLKQQYSYRQRRAQHQYTHTAPDQNYDSKNDISHDKPRLRDATHRSTQRQKIRYHKKLTLNDQLKLDIIKNMQYENRIRLNIKKFFKEDPTANEKITEMDKKSLITRISKQNSENMNNKHKLPPLMKDL